MFPAADIDLSNPNPIPALLRIIYDPPTGSGSVMNPSLA